MSYVTTTISLTKKQKDFLKEEGYSPSRLFQNQVTKLMKKSEGQDLRSHEPTDESLLGDSTNG